MLVDYKTDRTDAQTLIARYQKQLELYADALARILGKTVKRKLIYSLHLGHEIAL